MNIFFAEFIVYVGNTNSVSIYVEIKMKFEIRIQDIYKISKFADTWKSSNTYNLPNHVFLDFFFRYYYFISKY
jgi:hypothetical protein